MTFYLGTCNVLWLETPGAPLFVSASRFAGKKKLPRAACDWALDSGAFSHVNKHGGWTTSAREYAAEVRRISAGVGRMRWAAIQDWMCEKEVLEKTGLTVEEHQRLTVKSYHDLTREAPEIPWLPVLQGHTLRDYVACLDLYRRDGFDLTLSATVGIGSVCRRQGTKEAGWIIQELYSHGIRLHAFGYKRTGLRQSAHLIESADSMAWSRQARRERPLPGCTHKHCNHCRRYALLWRAGVMGDVEAPKQLTLFSHPG